MDNKKNEKNLQILKKVSIGIIVVMLPVCILGSVYMYNQNQLNIQQQKYWADIYAKAEELERKNAEIEKLGGNPDSDFKYVPTKTEDTGTGVNENCSESEAVADETKPTETDKKEDAAQPVEKPDEDKPAPSDKSTGTILPNTRSQIEMANNPVVGDIVYGSSGSPSRWDGKNWVYAGEPVGVR